MRHNPPALWVKLGLSILFAFILSIMPLPPVLQWFQPAWLLLVIIFWLFAEPGILGLVTIWLLGLYLDLLTESALGQHAIPLLVVSYLLIKFQVRWRIFPFARQFAVISVLITLYYLIQYQLLRFIHPITWHFYLLYPVISSCGLWIVVFKLLRSYEHELKKW
jgi:rod shape-determining protein MreD